MDQRHIEDFKSLDSMSSDLSETNRRHGNQHTNPNGRFNPAFGSDEDMMEMTATNGTQQPSSRYEDDVMMTDLTYANGSQPLRGGDDRSHSSRDSDEESNASTDTYTSGTSMSSEVQQNLRASLPSHLFREIRALPSAKSRRKIMNETPEGSVRHRQQRSVRHGLDETDFTAMADDDAVNPQDEIRHMATSLDQKKTVRNKVQDQMKEQERNISTSRYLKLRFAANWQHFKRKIVQMIQDNRLWSGPLKKIQGKFGTGVFSYFIFLRWLFLLNVLIFLQVCLFIFIPQIIYRPSVKYSASNRTSFHGTDLLDGRGWFHDTELYYGHYTSDTISISDGYGYSMPLAYLLTCGSYLLLCLIIMVSSMTSLYEKNYLQGGVGTNVLTEKIFTAWDYTVTDREACFIKQQSISTDIQEFLAETKDKRVLSRTEWFQLICLRILTNFISLALIACATYLIVEVVAGYSVEEDTTIFQELLLPLLVSFLNLLLPGMFRIIASFENYAHGATAIKVSLARTVILKLCTLAGIFVSLYRDISCASEKDAVDCRIYGCWENYVGQTMYRLVWVDFAFILLATFFGEFIRRLLASHVQWWEKNVGNPGFDISRNVLDLIYAQSLCWFGTFFSPLLSFICLLKLLVIFYVKKTSVLKNCRPSVRPFLASKMNLLFLVLLSIAYALILIAFGYAVTSESRLSPSNECGPFHGKDTIYQVVKDSVNDFPTVLREIIHNISSPSIIVLLFVVIGVFIYYYKLLKSSNEKKMMLLRDQIILTGKDKLYLMKKINQNNRDMEVEQ